MRLGLGEILIVLAIVLLVFGPTKIPQLGDAIGKGIRSFKRAVSRDDDSIDVSPSKAEQNELPAGSRAGSQARSGAESVKV